MSGVSRRLTDTVWFLVNTGFREVPKFRRQVLRVCESTKPDSMTEFKGPQTVAGPHLRMQQGQGLVKTTGKTKHTSHRVLSNDFFFFWFLISIGVLKNTEVFDTE